MGTVVMDKKEELVMRLVHYFVTECNYTPIIVNGVKNEVWLENIDGPYRIIRINSNYIHNVEQFNTDIFKIKNIVKQIKKKTLSFKVNTLNINLEINKGVKLSNNDNIDSIYIKSNKDVKDNSIIVNAFPGIKNGLMDDTKGIDLIINVTNDINEKTARDNKRYEKTFSPKKIIVTYVLIGINVLLFLLTLVNPNLFYLLANQRNALAAGQWYRLITAAFMHAGLYHIFFNMYSLAIIGSQVESFVGKLKYIYIYIFSAILGCLMSGAFSSSVSVGASGAIFGLLGSLLYFGYHYRLYLGTVIKNQIIPLIALNLLIGFMIPNIDVLGHIGGLIGGYLATMCVGVDGKTTTQERVNGIIVSILFIVFFVYMIMFR